MSSKRKFASLPIIFIFISFVGTIFPSVEAFAAQLQLSWFDNSTNEDGFKIERATGVGTPFTQIATAGANITTYNDSNLTAGTTYCYQVRAYNAAGDSPYSNAACHTASTGTVTFTLSVNLVNTITSAGTGSGSVTSSPTGISCGSDCSEAYASGTSITLTATPASGSVFSGWSGGCSGTGNCVLTITSNVSATATFAPQGVTLVVNKHGKGKVSSTPSGIDCGASCSANYVSGSTITLTPEPDPGLSFLGWSGGGCTGLGDCIVGLNANTSVTANFSTNIPASIGVFRPSTGEFFLDLDGNGQWNGCGVDACVTGLGQPGDLPVTGAWTNAQTLLGVFDPSTAAWYLDLNGNGALDGCELDTCRYVYGQSGDKPVVGDWTGTGVMRIGLFRPSTRGWYFDINGNGHLDSCKNIDLCVKSFGKSGDLPVVGDWTGNGKTKIGVFSPSTAQWVLDLNGDKKMGKRCAGDLCIASFGAPGDVPVVGDWDGTGTDNIGVFRPTTAEWFLDLNGNGIWDGCSVDACLSFGDAGDLPVVGKW